MLPKVHSERKVLLLLWTERRNFRANRSLTPMKTCLAGRQPPNHHRSSRHCQRLRRRKLPLASWIQRACLFVVSVFRQTSQRLSKKKNECVLAESYERTIWVFPPFLCSFLFFFLCHVYGLLINFITNHSFSSLCNSAKSLSVF